MAMQIGFPKPVQFIQTDKTIAYLFETNNRHPVFDINGKDGNKAGSCCLLMIQGLPVTLPGRKSKYDQLVRSKRGGISH